MKFQKYLIFNIWVCVTDSPWWNHCLVQCHAAQSFDTFHVCFPFHLSDHQLSLYICNFVGKLLWFCWLQAIYEATIISQIPQDYFWPRIFLYTVRIVSVAAQYNFLPNPWKSLLKSIFFVQWRSLPRTFLPRFIIFIEIFIVVSCFLLPNVRYFNVIKIYFIYFMLDGSWFYQNISVLLTTKRKFIFLWMKQMGQIIF